MYIQRELSGSLREAARGFPAVILTGPRRSGKTFLLKHLFPHAQYRLLEDPALVARFRADPQGFLAGLRPPAILDEVQNIPEIFPALRSLIDQSPRRRGDWLLTGSQEAPLMKNVTESMAGRAAVLQLLPFSFRERKSWSLLAGGFPEACLRPRLAPLWFSSYVQTYLERDVRAVLGVRDLPTFRRFMVLLAARHGQVLNKTDLAAPLGMSVPTIAQWITVLETTGQIIVVQPFYENFSKRLIKSPKIYWVDSGLACHLLGIESQGVLEKSTFTGALFEGFLASEIVKNQINRGRRRELYFFRDRQGLEVDFIVPGPGRRLTFVEAKYTSTPHPSMVENLMRLSPQTISPGPELRRVLVYRKIPGSLSSQAILPGVSALSVEEFLSERETF